MNIKEQVVEDGDQIICDKQDEEVLVDGSTIKVSTPAPLTTDEFWQMCWLFRRWFSNGGFLREELNRAFARWDWDLHWAVYELERLRRTRLASFWAAERMEEEYCNADTIAREECTGLMPEGGREDE